MKIMTLNIWNYEAQWDTRKQLIAELIQLNEPDVVALQETRHDFRYARGRGQGDQVADLTGYVSTSATAQVYIPILRVDEGLTILTRTPPKETVLARLTLNPQERDDENHRICLGVVVEVRGRDLCVFNTHFSLSAIARTTNALEAFRFVALQSGDRPAFLMGDLNAEPDSLPIRFLAGLEAIGADQSDFTDCWTAAHPLDSGYTYASWDPVRRIDYVFGRNVRTDIVRAEVVGRVTSRSECASDHMGVLIEFAEA
ncbi:MAG: endonuclease/exonuclease/phosphatase family protein [Chloroflexota bacterium]